MSRNLSRVAKGSHKNLELGHTVLWPKFVPPLLADNVAVNWKGELRWIPWGRGYIMIVEAVWGPDGDNCRLLSFVVWHHGAYWKYGLFSKTFVVSNLGYLAYQPRRKRLWKLHCLKLAKLPCTVVVRAITLDVIFIVSWLLSLNSFRATNVQVWISNLVNLLAPELFF